MWSKIKDLARLDPSPRQKARLQPGAQRLGDNPAQCQLLGLPKCADASTMGQWLRHQSAQSVQALQALCRDSVAWALHKAPASRVRHANRTKARLLVAPSWLR